MEQDLDRLLHNTAALILINIWEDNCEASLHMKELMEAFEHYATALVLRLSLTEYREWAQAHGIHGTPALVAYQQGRPLFRILGRVTPAELLQRLRQCGIEDL
jgi:thioredoxin-like negative regulator of GroEL